jgi:hypothetical protein
MSKPDHTGRPMSAFLNAHHEECAANDARNLADQQADEAASCEECGAWTDNSPKPVTRDVYCDTCQGWFDD